MKETMQLDFTTELAQLMKFTGETAKAIRMHSAYSGGSPAKYLGEPADPKRELVDLMFLADALHHFSRIGDAISDAIESGDPGHIIGACEATERIFKDYSKDQPDFADRQARQTFELWRDFVRLDAAINALMNIRTKAENALAPA